MPDNLKEILDEYWKCESLLQEAKDRLREEKKATMEGLRSVAERAAALRPVVIQSIKDCDRDRIYSRKKEFALKTKYKKEKPSEDAIEAFLINHGLNEEQIKAAFLIFTEQKWVPVEETIKLKAYT